ncbi:MAG: hypothetical protein GEV04_15760 [Actinophytocola sp.]|nr:hypothetical protein [Actinophytocola sp.]
MLLESRGHLHLAQGNTEQALAELQACGQTLHRIGYPNSAQFSWRSGAARCLLNLGERTQATELAAAQLNDARKFGATPWLGAPLRGLGIVRGGDEGIMLLREAVAVLEQRARDALVWWLWRKSTPSSCSAWGHSSRAALVSTHPRPSPTTRRTPPQPGHATCAVRWSTCSNPGGHTT